MSWLIFAYFSYEGTGRSLSLKLIQQLRQQSSTYGGGSAELKKTVNMTSKSDTVSSSSGNEARP